VIGYCSNSDKLTQGGSINDNRHIVTGPIVNDEPYAFRQLHMHWNRREKPGSEHSINGERFDLELHFVTEKMTHDDQRNQLVVLSSLFKVSQFVLQALVDSRFLMTFGVWNRLDATTRSSTS
jgi:carbonic anhydrase